VEGGFGTSDWNPNGGFLTCLLKTHDGTEYPFMSYRGKTKEFYIGFRPGTGKFGIAARAAHAANEQGIKAK
jgi:hypothetical protein